MGFKVKGILATICINIFALMAVDVASEINSLKEDLARLDYIFDTSIDMAVQNSMASEEFFSVSALYTRLKQLPPTRNLSANILAS